MSGLAIGDAAAVISDRMECMSDNSKRVKCDPNWEVWASSSVGIELAVVNQRPGSWASSGVGSTDMEDTTGICSDNDEKGVKLTWAIRELAILL